MIRFILLRLWPALIPLALYALWFAYRRHHARKTGEVIHIADGPWLMTILATMALLAAGFLWTGLTDEKTGPATYAPAHVEDGKIVQGEIHGR